jgi:TRAP-type C4-dicarboxylate transport system permease large subunit
VRDTRATVVLGVLMRVSISPGFVASVLAGAAFGLLTCVVCLVAWLAAGMRCDESCSMEQAPGETWAGNSDAGQWTAIGGLGTAILLLALIAALLVITGHRRAALITVSVHAAASVPLAALLHTAHPGAGWWAWTILAPAAGLIMLLTAPTRWRGDPRPAIACPSA